MRVRWLCFGFVLVAVVGVLAPASGAPASGSTVLVSRSNGGAQGNLRSFWPSISRDGRYVAFESFASNLSDQPMQGLTSHVYVFDAVRERLTLVDTAPDGTPGDSDAYEPVVSGDGRFVVFESRAGNLGSLPRFHNAVYAREIETGRVSLVSKSSDGLDAGGSCPCGVSFDGRFVSIRASSLEPADTNGFVDVYLVDRDLDGDGVFDEPGGTSVERVSVSSSGEQANGDVYYSSVSDDGLIVAFDSAATNLDPSPDTDQTTSVYVRDRASGTTKRLHYFSTTSGNRPFVSGDGRYVMYTRSQVLVYDRVTGSYQGASVRPDGGWGNRGAYGYGISQNGRFVVFTTGATDLVGCDGPQGDVYVRDMVAGKTSLVSVSSLGFQGDGYSTHGAVAATADSVVSVAFQSESSNLSTPPSTNGATDIFLRTWPPRRDPGPYATALGEQMRPLNLDYWVYNAACDALVASGL